MSFCPLRQITFAALLHKCTKVQLVFVQTKTETFGTPSGCFDSSSVVYVLHRCSRSSDWEYAAENMVRLGFVLMDSYGPKGAFGKIQEGLPTRQKKPTEKTGDMGAKILLETFKVCQHFLRQPKP